LPHRGRWVRVELRWRRADPVAVDASTNRLEGGKKYTGEELMACALVAIWRSGVMSSRTQNPRPYVAMTRSLRWVSVWTSRPRMKCWQVLAQQLPVVAVVEADVDGRFRPCEEQARLLGIDDQIVDPASGALIARQAIDDAGPGLASVDGAPDQRTSGFHRAKSLAALGCNACGNVCVLASSPATMVLNCVWGGTSAMLLTFVQVLPWSMVL